MTWSVRASERQSGRTAWRWGVTGALVAGALALAGCGPTYPKARVAEAVVEMCQKEYRLDVQAKLEGTTLSVLLPARRLFDTPVTVTPDTDPQTLNQLLRFSEQGVDQLQDVALAVRRVVLSTDAPVEFYVVIIRDADGGQLELHWLGHALDLRRLHAMDISQGDFLKYRAAIFFRAIPLHAAREAVQSLFEDLRRRASIPTLSKYFSPQADLQSLLPFLIHNLVPASRPGEGMATLAELKARQVDVNTVLVFARTLVPSDGVQPVREQGYYFVVEVGELRGVIVRVIPVPARARPPSGAGRWPVPAEFTRLGSPDRWPDEELFVPVVSLPKFLAEQVARRIRLDLGLQPQLAGLAIAADYADDLFQFHFRLGKPPAPPPDLSTGRVPRGSKDHPLEVPDPTTSQGLAAVIAQTTARVVKSYDFTQFKGVAISDIDSQARWLVPAEQLPLYRRRAVPLVPAAP